MIPELTTLVAIARAGTFAAAGAKVGLTQAAVSAQIRRLETHLGFALFDRSGRVARLTPQGRETVERAQELVGLWEGLGSRRSGSAPPARVSIGAIASVQRTILPDVLGRFHKRHRECRSRVLPGLSMGLLDMVHAGEIEMAAIIRPPFTLQSDLRWTTLASEPFRLLVPRGVKGRDWAALLASHPFIRYDRTSFGGRQVDRFLREAHVPVNDACEVDELDAIIRLVSRGLGVALVPQATAYRHWPAGVRAVNLGKHTFHRDIGLVERAGLTGSAAALAALVVEAYPERSAGPGGEGRTRP